jgi:sulfonate transport system substrate-binding protein
MKHTTLTHAKLAKKNRTAEVFAALLAAFCVLTALGGCAKKSPSPPFTMQGDNALLRVAWLPTANYFTILAGDSAKDTILELEAEFIGPSAPVDAINLVTLGRADVTTTGTGYFVNLLEQGGQWVAFALEKYSGDSQGIVAAPNTGIETLRDLYGKKIGIAQRGATADYIVNTAFAWAGLDVSQVEKVELRQADLAAAFASGQIDALASFDQNFANALSIPGAKKLVDGRNYDSINWTIHIAAKAFADKHPEALKAAYRALRTEAAKAQSQPSLITDTYREFGASHAQTAIIADFDVPQILPMDAQAVADLATQAEQYVRYGFIKEAPRDFQPFVLDFSGADAAGN